MSGRAGQPGDTQQSQLEDQSAGTWSQTTEPSGADSTSVKIPSGGLFLISQMVSYRRILDCVPPVRKEVHKLQTQSLPTADG